MGRVLIERDYMNEKKLYEGEYYTESFAESIARKISFDTDRNYTQYAILLIASVGGRFSEDGADPITHEFLDKVAKAWFGICKAHDSKAPEVNRD
jgi:hypothetical protein